MKYIYIGCKIMYNTSQETFIAFVNDLIHLNSQNKSLQMIINSQIIFINRYIHKNTKYKIIHYFIM